MTYFLSIDYEEYNTKSYKGVVISSYENEQSIELIRLNTGSPELDEKRALRKLYDLVGEVEVVYMSSYDNYFMDFEYENNSEYRAEVDKMNEETQNKIKEYKKEIGKSEDEELTVEEFNYIINKR